MTDLEITMLFQLKALGLPIGEEEYRFHPSRKWRFDRCWPECRLALEIEGGTRSAGRHVRPQGYEDDCEKYNEATLLGWRLLRVTSAMIADGRAVTLVERGLATSLTVTGAAE